MIIPYLEKMLQDQFSGAGVSPEFAVVRASDRPDIAHFQCNGVFAAAKEMGIGVVALATKIVGEKLCYDGVTLSVGGAGFINITLSSTLIERFLSPLKPRESKCKNAIIDFGGPNIAKPMHVGHLRSLFLGDSLSRIYTYCGYSVLKDIHLGDWGYQMGLLLAATQDDEFTPTLQQLEEIYPAASARAKIDPEFKQLAQEMTVELQKGGGAAPSVLCRWREMVALSAASVRKDLDRVGIKFDVWNGESDANAGIATVEERLTLLGMVENSGGALVVPIDGMPPLMLRNGQGGALYGATDLATILTLRHNAKIIVYVVDDRQSLHFKQVFNVAKRADMTKGDLVHVGFGTVNGADGKPLKTRDGGVPKLSDLLEEVSTAAKSRGEFPESSNMVAIAALKFGDLQNKRMTNYVYDPQRFLKNEGKTGPYICYQAVRIKSIIEKALAAGLSPNPLPDRPLAWHETPDSWFSPAFELDTQISIDLALLVIGFDQVVDQAFAEHAPHHIADYAYKLATTFSRYYGEGSIADSPPRLALVGLVLERLVAALGLLGITVPEKM